MSRYLNEAFKSLSLLEDVPFEINSDKSYQDLDDFVSDDIDEREDIIDLDAESEEELKDSYVDDAILSCCVCHTNLFKPMSDIVIDTEDETICNVDDVCPVCGNTAGYKLIGKVAPFHEEEETEVEVEAEPEDEFEVEVKDKEDIEESFKRLVETKKLDERALKSKINEGLKLTGLGVFMNFDDMSDDEIDKIIEILDDNNIYHEDPINGVHEEKWISLPEIDSVGKSKLELLRELGLADFNVEVESLKLNEKLPKDLARAYKAANYNEYSDVMSGDRSKENYYSSGDPNKMTPKEVGPYIDYEKAEYREITPEEAKALKPSQWKNLRMIDGVDLVVLTPSGTVNTRVSDPWLLRRKSAPEIFDLVDKIYLTNEKSGDAYLSPDQLAKRQKKWASVYDPESYLNYYTREYNPNSLERATGRHTKDDSYNVTTLERYKKYLNGYKDNLAELETSYENGDISRKQYEADKERIESRIADYEDLVAEWQSRVDTDKQKVRNQKARIRFFDQELSLRSLQNELMDKISKRKSIEAKLKDAMKELDTAKSGAAGKYIVSGERSWDWERVQNINAKREELEKARKELEELKAKIAQLEAETTEEAENEEIKFLSSKVDQEEANYEDIQHQIDALLKKVPANESLTEDKDLSNVKGTIAFLIKKYNKEYQKAIDAGFDKNSIIGNFIGFVESHLDELDDAGYKRFEEAKKQLWKMKNLTAVLSFIGTLATGIKVNEGLEKATIETEDQSIEVKVEDKTEEEFVEPEPEFIEPESEFEEPEQEETETEVEETEEEVKESLKEDFEKATIETDDQVIEVTTEPKDVTEEVSDEEMIAPLSDEDVAKIEAGQEEEEPVEEVEETEETEVEENPEEAEELNFDEIQEESFNRLTERYLRNVYSNVDSFKLTDAELNGNQIKLEGVIKFNSGKEKKTQFIFEKVANQGSIAKNKVRFIGLNETFTNKKNAFVLKCDVEDNKLVSESLRYNYQAKTSNLNEGIKIVKGLVK